MGLFYLLLSFGIFLLLVAAYKWSVSAIRKIADHKIKKNPLEFKIAQQNLRIAELDEHNNVGKSRLKIGM